MEEGNIYKIEFSPMSTSNYFEKGHSVFYGVHINDGEKYDRQDVIEWITNYIK